MVNFALKYRSIVSFNTIAVLIMVVASTDPIVHAPAGTFRGSEILDPNGEPMVVFYGIPYAKPPVGNLRFAKPQPLEKIDGVFNATTSGIECPTPALPMFSHYMSGREDCLILNVFTKQLYPPSSKRKVIVFIHGGGFIVGSSAPYFPGTFINAHDVIVVTINYRLGILGFLSTEDSASLGNYGLWDMVLALTWVQNNIAAFGGDPDDVTISGESAGGSAVSYLTLAAPAKDLFKKAYAQSGTATSMFGRATRARKNALDLAISVGCGRDVEVESLGEDDSREVLACLRELPLEDFTKFTSFSMDESKFVPRVDGDFVPMDPLLLLQDTDHLRSVGFFEKAHLVSVDNNERSVMRAHIKLNEFLLLNITGAEGPEAQRLVRALHESTWKFLAGGRLGSNDPPQQVVREIQTWYDRRFGSDALVELAADLNFVIPSLDYVEATTQVQTNAWLLYFNHYPQMLTGRHRGMPHGFDLMYWFDFPLDLMKVFISDNLIDEMGHEDLQLKRSFSSLIAAFVKTGDPSSALSGHIPSGIPRYDCQRRTHIEFCPSSSLGSNLVSTKREFWMTHTLGRR